MFTQTTKLRTPVALLLFIVLVTSLVGCTSPTSIPTLTAPTVDLQPTLNAVQTLAAQTVITNLTKNAPTAVLVTATLAASSTPAATATQAPPAATSTALLPTAVPTATYIPWTLTPTVAPYSCSLISTAPPSTTTYAVNTNFDVQWVVKNTGINKWLMQETDARFSAGAKMQKLGDIQDLKNDVASGENYTVLIDMVAPATVGTYSVTWILITGKITICTMSASIIVK